MIRTFILSVCAVLAWMAGTGQGALKPIPFTEKTWNFGKIHEEKGVVSHAFTFTNNGKQPIVIEHVEVNCGCTTTDFSRKPVMPGRSGHITVTFDPADRPGPFTKLIVVTANNRTMQTTLSVSGTVVERVRSVTELYPVELGGGMRIDTRSAYFRNVGQGRASSVVVKMANTSSREAALSFQVEPACEYLKISAPGRLPAGGKGQITVTFDLTGTKSAYGVFSSNIYMVIDGRRDPVPISAVAYGIDDFGDNPDPDRSARARFDRQFHDFADIKPGQTPLKTRFALTDAGTLPLVVRYVHCGRGLTTDLKAGTVIGTSKTQGFEVVLDPSAHSGGIVNESILIVVNDPLRPVRQIRIAAEIR